MHCLLHFDFYGAGNVGDDLMVDGFMKTLDTSISLSAFSAYAVRAQSSRFSRASWIASQDQPGTNRAYQSSDAWIGVGDTPVQIKGGDWFLNRLLRDAERARQLDKPMFLCGVGAEVEALQQREAFKRALEPMRHIWTRDAFSQDVYMRLLDNDASRVTAGSDLAHITLEQIFGESEPAKDKSFEVALCFFDEQPQSGDVLAVGEAIRAWISQNKNVCFVANETRKTRPFEYWLYRQLFGPLERFRNRGRLQFFSPSYGTASTEDLVRHYPQYKTVVTSRYHSLLTAAWAGCNVVALERSSKVSALAKELGVFEIKKPFTRDDILAGCEQARPVSREMLQAAARRAVASVDQLHHHLNKHTAPVSL